MSKSRPRQLLVNSASEIDEVSRTPTTTNLDRPKSPVKNQRTLKQLWNEADKRFFDETGYHIDTPAPLHKHGVLQKWQSRYSVEKSEMRDKADRLFPVLQKIVNGVEIVGGFAASAASAVFGPAQICFNAITFVLDAPAKIRQVYDTLEALFKEVSNFLVKFKVLDRIDEKNQLDEELLEDANKLLISFTYICAKAGKLMKKHYFVQALETVFLMDDGGVKAALIEFRDLATNQAQIVGVVSLEHVLNNERLCRQVLSEQHDLIAYLRAMSIKENDEKTGLINKQKVAEIERKLFPRSELDQLVQTQQTSNFMPGTLDAFMASKEYISWSAIDRVGTSELYLSGAEGTGKTHLMDALREHLDHKRQKMRKGAPSLYVAHHSFADPRTTATSNNAVAQAVKNLALQVASQSTRYATRLVDELKDQKLIGEDSHKRVWSTLKLFDFNPPPGSVMYLLIDGIQGGDGLKSAQALRALLVDAKGMDDAGGRYKVCFLLAAESEVMFDINVQRSTVINVEKLNEKLLSDFIDHQLQVQEILTESEEKIKTQRAKFVSALLKKCKGNFRAARQKIKRMKEALDNDATSGELEDIIEEDVQQTLDQQARETLNSLADGLSSRHLNQLKKILMWMLYGIPSAYSWPILDLQAVLRLEQHDQTLESLSKKITKRFHKVLRLFYGSVYLEWTIREYLRQLQIMPDAPELDEDARLISMTINIKNAKKIEVQKFILDLNARLTSDTSIFLESPTSSQTCRIQISEVRSFIEITLLSLTALNEGTPDDAAYALTYAFIWLPRNLTELLKLKDDIPSADWRQIQVGLINFLSEPYYLEQGPDLDPRDSWEDAWFGDLSDAESFYDWLEECLMDPGSHSHLQARQRRWLKKAATRNDGRPDYLRETALAIARRWRTACLEQKRVCILPYYEWLDGYLNFLTVVEEESEEEEKSSPLTEGNAEPDDIKAEVDVSDSHVGQQPGSTGDDGATSKEGGGEEAAEEEPAVDDTSTNAAVSRLYRVADWVKENLAAVEEDVAHSYCIAISLVQMTEFSAAVTRFETVRSDGRLGWMAIISMARVKSEEEKSPEEATALYREAISLARGLHREDKLVKHEFDLFVDTLKRLSDILMKDLKQNEDAIHILREILEHSPKDGECRWSLFTALCKEKHYSEANELLDTWSQHPEEYGDQGPCTALRAMAADDADILSLFDATQEPTLRSRVIDMLQQAANDAKNCAECLEQARMLYVLATVHASSPAHEDHPKVLGYLEQILEHSQAPVSDHGELDEVVLNALRFAARMKFDDTRKQMLRHGPADPATLRDDLNDYIKRKTVAIDYTLINPFQHVASLCMIMDQPEWSSNRLSEEISVVVEILSDDIPENDLWGIRRAIRPLFCHGSDVDARIAFSLLDRTVRRNTLLQPEKDGNADDINNNNGNDDDDASGEGDPRRCNICRGLLQTIEGLWICRWCPDVDFCQPCIEAFRKGDKFHEHCGPDHDFVRLYHPECGVDELESGKVFMDWEIQYEENGNFSRKGGRLADMSEWVEKLRVEWELSAPSTDTRAQA